MTVAAIRPDYTGERMDSLDRFHGNQVVYVCWDHHLMFCSPAAFPLPPETPFAALTAQVLPSVWGAHPELALIDWGKAAWRLDGEPFVPRMDVGLAAQGIGHKSCLRFRVPGLDGIGGIGF